MKDKIRELRIKRKLSQQQLADKLGIKRTTVTNWEAGRACPKMAMLPALAEALKCKVDVLFCKCMS